VLDGLPVSVDIRWMYGLGIVTAVAALALAGVPAFAQGVAPGGPIGGSTGIGSGLGGVGGTGPSWPNGTNQAPQPSIPSVPPGGYASPAPSSTYTPSPRAAAPSTSGGSTYRQPNEPYPTSSVRPPATIPMVLPEKPNGSLAFVKGCWRTDNFAYAQHRGTITWCFDHKGGGRYLYTRTDQPNVFFCHALAQATWNAGALELRGAKLACDDGSANAPAEFICRDGTDGALCASAGQSWTVRLFRVR
jgi:hypothetical protein